MSSSGRLLSSSLFVGRRFAGQITFVTIAVKMFPKTVSFALLVLLGTTLGTHAKDVCNAKVVETLPADLKYDHVNITSTQTYNNWIELINGAKKSLDIASFYWTLRCKDVMEKDPVPECKQGEDVLQAIIDAGKRSVKIRIAVNDQTRDLTDLDVLKEVADIRKVNFTRLVGAGILHTKFMIIDGESFYVGSANMDWRSLTHVKEMGIGVTACPALAKDLAKVFDVYWQLGGDVPAIPDKFPAEDSTKINSGSPLDVTMNGEDYSVYFASSPKQFCPQGRSVDIDAILDNIEKAEKFIYIAVMDYFPIFLYGRPTRFWPVIDDALRKAAIERGVHVKLLGSHWDHTRKSMPLFLRSLSSLNDAKILHGSIETKLFTIPSTEQEKKIPFARVNHNKYMITEKTAYIGTSNWSADYFVSTGGVGMSISPKDNKTSELYKAFKQAFERDWNSVYAATA